MYKSKYKIKEEEKADYMKEYNVRFFYKNGKVYVDENVSVKDVKTKAEFLKRVAPFTDDIVQLIKDFNS